MALPCERACKPKIPGASTTCYRVLAIVTCWRKSTMTPIPPGIAAGIHPRLAEAPWPRPARPERVVREAERLTAAARELAASDPHGRAAGLWLAEIVAQAPP